MHRILGADKALGKHIASNRRPVSLFDFLTPALHPSRTVASVSTALPWQSVQESDVEGDRPESSFAAAKRSLQADRPLQSRITRPELYEATYKARADRNGSSVAAILTDFFFTDFSDAAQRRVQASSFDVTTVDQYLDACITEVELKKAARHILAFQLIGKDAATRVAKTGHLLLQLATRPLMPHDHSNITSGIGRREAGGRFGSPSHSTRDQTVSSLLREEVVVRRHVLFSPSVHLRLAQVARDNMFTNTLEALLALVEQRLLDPRSFHHPRNLQSRDLSSNAALACHSRAEANGISKKLASQIGLALMKGFSRLGQSYHVDHCFRMLRRADAPMLIWHYQYQIIAMANLRAQDLAEHGKTPNYDGDAKLQRDLLQLKAMMEENNISLDDKFLTTVVYGLGAPLRNPLLRHAATTHMSLAIKLVRSIADLLLSKSVTSSALEQRSGDRSDRADATLSADASDATSSDQLQRMPKLRAALVHVELDALDALKDGPESMQTVKRTRTLLDLDRPSADLLGSNDTAANTPLDAPAASSDTTESAIAEVDSLYFQLRMALSSKKLKYANTLLGRLLDVDVSRDGKERSPESITSMSDEAEASFRHVTLRQRSGAILGIKTALESRSASVSSDPCLDILAVLVQHGRFQDVWKTTLLPSNPSALHERDQFDPVAVQARMWKRWACTWSKDVLSEGRYDKAPRAAATRSNSMPLDQQRTFAGREPWKTLRTGLELLLRTVTQLQHAQTGVPMSLDEAGHRDTRDGQIQDGTTTASDALAAQFRTVFAERGTTDTMCRAAVRGGRRARRPDNKPEAAFVEKLGMAMRQRLLLVVEALRMVQAPAVIWTRIRHSVLKHAAAVEPERLWMPALTHVIDEIDRHHAEACRRRDASLQRHRRSPSPETASVFVLRTILSQRNKTRTDE
ncbi:hypothetical protein BCV70DRAFT_202321 [Testicularia cyperi]|uniref:Uncharacterized protein n=1 Tax=Testicularia cyperi TaxID=1882483 RepID=A0A317XJA9_9BASI|nr:hypothetical protein BCV70DRAFT_202321 [Testicularia cyperi]